MLEETKALAVSTIAYVRSGLARRLGWLGVGLTGALPVVAAVGLIAPLHAVASALATGLGALSLALFAASGAAFAMKGRRQGTVRLEPGKSGSATGTPTLRIDREGQSPWTVPLPDITTGWLMPDPWRLDGRLLVLLQLKDGDQVHAAVENADDGFELLSAAGVDSSDQRVKVRRRQHGQFTGAFLLTLLFSILPAAVAAFTVGALESGWGMLVYAVGFVWMMRGALSLLSPGDLTVGADGVSFGKYRPRLIPIHELSRARIESEALFLDRPGGESVGVQLGPVDPAYRAMLAHRINRAIALAAEAERIAPVAELDRNGRSLEDWRHAAGRILGGGDDGYRAAQIPRLRVEQILEDSHASPERRLGAAIALAATGDADAQRVLLRVAEATADPHLEEALVETAEGRLGEVTADRLAK